MWKKRSVTRQFAAALSYCGGSLRLRVSKGICRKGEREREAEVMIRRNDVKRVVERGEGKGSLESSDPLQVSSNPKHSLRLLPLLPSLSRLNGAVAACFCRGLPGLHSWPAKTRTQHGRGREARELGRGKGEKEKDEK